MNKIRNAVMSLIAKHGCAEPCELCEKMGITILPHELPARINGFTVYMEGIPFIVLNSALADFERRITTAHELGHIILHKSTNTVALSINTSFCVNKYEREADCFAAYLLIEAERNELYGMETVTSEQLSMMTHLPLSMIEDALFGQQ